MRSHDMRTANTAAKPPINSFFYGSNNHRTHIGFREWREHMTGNTFVVYIIINFFLGKHYFPGRVKYVNFFYRQLLRKIRVRKITDDPHSPSVRSPLPSKKLTIKKFYKKFKVL